MTLSDQSIPYWEHEEQVERFARRDPDRRMVELLESVSNPAEIRVLDLGCAGGRNTVWLAQLGFDVYAVDASRAMVAETVRRLEPVLGRRDAQRRVQVGRMDDLSRFPDNSFGCVLAVGILHNAHDRSEWERALDEIARVAAPGSSLIVSTFSPGSHPSHGPLVPSEADPHVHSGFAAGPLYLVQPEELDLDLLARGFRPARPTTLVRRESDSVFRVAVNGVYRRVASWSRTPDVAPLR